jgi:predicted alpha/beta superfamily hydrolase
LIEGSYNVSADRGLHGHSLGGLFVGYTFFATPDAFTRYAMTSPSFWWDAGFIYGLEKDVRPATSNTPKRVYMSVGQLEGPRMQASMWRLADQLCDAHHYKYPGISVTAEYAENLAHATPVERVLSALYPEFDGNEWPKGMNGC